MEICYHSGSILFSLNLLAVAGFIVMCLFKFKEILCYRPLPQSQQNLKTRKKSAGKKKKKAKIEDNKVADNSHSQLEDESDVEALSQSNSEDSPVADNSHSQESAVEALSQSDSPVEGLRQFTYQSLEQATYGFRLHFQTYADKLGGVFKVKMLHTDETFAVKLIEDVLFFWPNKEFYQELFYQDLSLLSQLNHPNLAKLIGYSIQPRTKALVYEYLRGGSLENYLHGNKMCLDWRTRMKIVAGVARAIQYLQNYMNPPIQHCYIEPANVWLDEDLTPKLSAAGMIRMFSIPHTTGYPIEMRGSYAYAANDYYLTGTITLTADIYGFGILLLEVITARKGIFYTQDGETRERQTLIDWVQPYFKGGDFTEMVDPRIKGKIDENELNEACAIARACLEKQPGSRPKIADVVRGLDRLVG